MRSNEFSKEKQRSAEIFGVSFHDFLEKQSTKTSMELASEFGVSLSEIKKLRKHMEKR